MRRFHPSLFLPLILGASLTCPLASVDTTRACDTSRDLVSPWKKDVFCAPAGSQISVIANIARDTVRGKQVSLFANIASTRVQCSQVSAGLNYAREAGSQISWNVNIAHRVENLQFGSWNIADTVKGMQIGFVNLSKQVDGTSLGLLTLSKNGLLHVNVSTEETGMGHLTFASGHKLYTAFDFGFTPDDENHPFSLGVGLGRHWDFVSTYLEAELFLHMIADERTTDSDWRHHGKHGGFNDDGLNHLVQAKLRFGQPLFAGVGCYAGLSYNALIHGDNEPLIHPWRDSFTQVEDKALFWPGIEIGLRFGR